MNKEDMKAPQKEDYFLLDELVGNPERNITPLLTLTEAELRRKMKTGEFPRPEVILSESAPYGWRVKDIDAFKAGTWATKKKRYKELSRPLPTELDRDEFDAATEDWEQKHGTESERVGRPRDKQTKDSWEETPRFSMKLKDSDALFRIAQLYYASLSQINKAGWDHSFRSTIIQSLVELWSLRTYKPELSYAHDIHSEIGSVGAETQRESIPEHIICAFASLKKMTEYQEDYDFLLNKILFGSKLKKSEVEASIEDAGASSKTPKGQLAHLLSNRDEQIKLSGLSEYLDAAKKLREAAKMIGLREDFFLARSYTMDEVDRMKSGKMPSAPFLPPIITEPDDVLFPQPESVESYKKREKLISAIAIYDRYSEIEEHHANAGVGQFNTTAARIFWASLQKYGCDLEKSKYCKNHHWSDASTVLELIGICIDQKAVKRAIESKKR